MRAPAGCSRRGWPTRTGCGTSAPGQAAWIHGNACTYVLVAPYRRSPLPLPAGTRQPLVPSAGPAAAEAGDRGRSGGGPEVPLPGGVSMTELLDRPAGADDGVAGGGGRVPGAGPARIARTWMTRTCAALTVHRMQAAHPDNGGDPAAAAAVTAAYDALRSGVRRGELLGGGDGWTVA